MNMNWDYISGFFDGEGNIYVYRGRVVRIQIAQKPVEVLQEIQQWLKDTHNITSFIAVHKNPTGNVHSLRINRQKEVKYFLEHINLIVKKEEQRKALEVINKAGIRGRFSPEEKQQMKLLWENNLSASEIAEELRRPLRSVQFWCYLGQKGSDRLIYQ